MGPGELLSALVTVEDFLLKVCSLRIRENVLLILVEKAAGMPRSGEGFILESPPRYPVDLSIVVQGR